MKATTLDRIAKAVQERPEQLMKAKGKGAKVVGYFCSYMPEEIIHALGLIPLRLGRGGSDDLVEIGGRYIGKGTCVFLRESVGLFAEGKEPFSKSCDLVAVATSCVQMFRLAEVIHHFFKVPTLVLGVPRNFYLPQGRVYFQKEVENLSRQLEEFAGNKLAAAALRESVELYRNIRQTLLKIYDFQAADPAPISWREVFDVVHAGFYLDRADYYRLLQDLLSELTVLSEALRNAAIDERPRILLSGTNIPPGDTKLINIIEEAGGRIVGDDLCSGLRFISGINVEEPSMAGVADAYLDKIPCATLPFLPSLEADRRLGNLSQLIDNFRPEGMIYHTLRLCDAFTFKAAETKRFINDKISFMEIHTEYADSDIEAIRTRIDAFIEVLEGRRRSRLSKAAIGG